MPFVALLVGSWFACSLAPVAEVETITGSESLVPGATASFEAFLTPKPPADGSGTVSARVTKVLIVPPALA